MIPPGQENDCCFFIWCSRVSENEFLPKLHTWIAHIQHLLQYRQSFPNFGCPVQKELNSRTKTLRGGLIHRPAGTEDTTDSNKCTE
ncbi:hypothetical protein CRM22_003048 [Opisthorchis felineus]|uniref:Uncharacterized protein n=2 Tax=Opisthorchis felineus TaxID=147828 RepID=A0A4V3SG21_OPIFE|nr:hypothetical protein CRM22_003048 [Opisthorchis felineus]